MNDAEKASFQKDLVDFFSATREELEELFRSFEESPRAFTGSRVSEMFKLDVQPAEERYNLFLHLIHEIAEHMSSDELMKELVGVGCDSKNVTYVVKKIDGLSSEHRQIADVLNNSSYFVDDSLHVNGLASSVSYREVRRKGENSLGIMPIVGIKMDVEINDKPDTIFLYFPVTEFGQFAHSIKEAEISTREKVKRFMKENGIKNVFEG